MKYLIILLLFFTSPILAQYGTYYNKRQAPQKSNVPYLMRELARKESEKERQDCINAINNLIENAETKDYFKPDISTAIDESFLVNYNGYYYVIIVFTTSDKPYLYSTEIELCNSFKSAGIYSAGKSFNKYIHPYKLCEY